MDLLQFNIMLTQIENFLLFNIRYPYFDTTTFFEKSLDATREPIIYLHILRFIDTPIRGSTILSDMLFLVILKLQVGELGSFLTACHSMTFESKCQYES